MIIKWLSEKENLEGAYPDYDVEQSGCNRYTLTPKEITP